MTCTPSASHVAVHKDKVRMAVGAQQAEIGDLIESRRTAMVDNNVKLDQRKWWEKLIGRPARYRTREEVIVDLQKYRDDWYGVLYWNIPKIKYRNQLKRLEALQRLVEKAEGDTVMIGVDDAWIFN